jgi:hypothetical protein
MRVTDRGKRIVVVLCYVLLSIVFHIASVYAEELQPSQAPARNIKGFWEVDLYTQTTVRTVVEEINPGSNFEGDAESTRVMAKLATRPLRPVEFYLQAGMANLVIDQFNDYRGDYGFAYGGGVSLTVYEYPGPKKFKVITRADTLNFETTDHVLTVIHSQDVFVKETIGWREYTLEGIGIWKSQYWEPFIGARFSWLDSRDTIEDPRVGRLSLKEDSNLGMVVGTTLYFDPRENFAFNAEATLIDQFSLKIGIKLWY